MLETPRSIARFRLENIPPSPLYWSGLLLVVSGIFHFGVWLHTGDSWEGAVSWRKPILFGFSTGLTLWSIGWIQSQMRSSRWERLFSWGLSVALVLEVGLITLQQWRGQPSHFNHGTTFDSAVEYGMTALIIIATWLIGRFTWRVFRELDTQRDRELAIKAGLIFLIISCLIGFWVSFHGQLQLGAGKDPSLYGKAGVTKFPHGVAIHALQFLPALGWLFQKRGLSIESRVRLMGYSIGSTGTLLAFAVTQTLLGKSRLEPNVVGGFLLALTVMLAGPVILAVLKKPMFREPGRSWDI